MRVGRFHEAHELARPESKGESALARGGQRHDGDATRAQLAVVERALSVRAEQARLELQTTLGTLAAAMRDWVMASARSTRSQTFMGTGPSEPRNET